MSVAKDLPALNVSTVWFANTKCQHRSVRQHYVSAPNGPPALYVSTEWTASTMCQRRMVRPH